MQLLVGVWLSDCECDPQKYPEADAYTDQKTNVDKMGGFRIMPTCLLKRSKVLQQMVGPIVQRRVWKRLRSVCVQLLRR